MADPELTDWCKHHGVSFHGIVAAYVSEGWRGIVATEDIQLGHVVLRVPERVLITTRSAARDPALTAALNRHRLQTAGSDGGGASCRGGDGLSPHQVLCFHILLEVSRGPASGWWPYLKQLPRSYTSLANFAPEDVEALQLPYARDVASAAVDNARAEWRGALPVLLELGLPKRFTSFSAWLWAHSTVHSRTMYLPWCPAGALTPYGDLHNYQPPPPPYTPQLGRPVASTPVTATATATFSTGPALAPAPRDPKGGAVAIEWAAAAAAAPSPVSSSSVPPGVRGVIRLISSGGRVTPGGATGEGAARGRGRDDSELVALAPGGPGMTDVAEGREAEGMGAGDTGYTQYPREDGGEESTCSSKRVGNSRGCSERCSGQCSGQRIGRCSFAAGNLPGREENPPGSGGNARGSEESYTCTARDVVYGSCGGDAAADVSQLPLLDSLGARAGSGSGGGGGGENGKDGSHGTTAGDGMWDEVAQQYCIVVRRSYRRGDQVMLCYGRYTNLELLEHYGFLLQENPHDTVLLDPGLLPLPAAVRSAVTASALPYLNPADCFLHANGQPSWKLLHWLRLAAVSPQERRRFGHLLAAGERASEQGDRLTCQWLHTACSRQLSALPTSLQEDERLRQQQELEQQRGQQRGQQSQLKQPGRRLQSQGKQEQQQWREGQHGQEQRIQETGDGSSANETVGPASEVAEVEAGAAAAVGGCRAKEGTELCDGLTCPGLALQWRMQQKQILKRALECMEEVLGSSLVAGSGLGRGEVVRRDLATLIQQQRRPPGAGH